MRDSHNGPPRKYYRITERGKEYLAQMIDEWHSIVKSVVSFGIPFIS